MNIQHFNIKALHENYAEGGTVEEIINCIYSRIEEVADPGIFIHLLGKEEVLEQVTKLGNFDPIAKPLWGIPFAVKDNIDVAGIPTTAACPTYAYTPEKDAFCVKLLRDAGALLIGKTNLDQFATGLVGLRSPFQPPKNAINPEIVPGGSSSGSAVAVAHGIVSFALGTDTAGSGRIPAALNNIIGLKPTLGSISASGVVPACKTLDTVSIFALTVDDAYSVFQVANVYDKSDPYAREIPVKPLSPVAPNITIGVPNTSTLELFGDRVQQTSFSDAIKNVQGLGGKIIELDFTPLYEIAKMLYEGSWVAERYAVLENFIKDNSEDIHPITLEVIMKGQDYSAADAFRDLYKLKELRRKAETLINAVDTLMVPSAPTYYTVSEVAADPIGTNSKLGTYTNFVNLLDWCGFTVPTTLRTDKLPGSITLIADKGQDDFLASLARKIHAQSNSKMGATSWGLPELAEVSLSPSQDEIELAVVGAHMSGLPLNGELTRLNARFLRKSKTAPYYRFYALAGGPPKRPGLVKDNDGGSIELETWAIPRNRFGEFIAGIPHPLGIGTITLESNEEVKGFICEPAGLNGAEEITSYGGWRNYLKSV